MFKAISIFFLISVVSKGEKADYWTLLALHILISVHSLKCHKKKYGTSETETIDCVDRQGCEIYHDTTLLKKRRGIKDDFEKGCDTTNLAIPFDYCMSYTNAKTKVNCNFKNI